LPEDYFRDPDKFDALSRSAIHDFWDLGQQDRDWTEKVTGRWQRFLIRMFVVATAISPSPTVTNAVASTTAICDLRNVLIMAGHSTQVARLMLRARFGEDLSSPYAVPPGWTTSPFLRACLPRYLDVVSGDRFREVVVVPIRGYGENGIAKGSHALKMSLLDVSHLSLSDLSGLGDAAITDVLDDLVSRNRCGAQLDERLQSVDNG
jgi:hypothetical protein